MHDTLITHDMFVRHTDNSGTTRVERYRVWDSERYLKSLTEAAKKVAKEAFDKDQPCCARVELIDEPTYLKERTK